MVFIKSVSLNCFRSYRDQAGKQNFSDKTNAIVGLNGKGKSNFFYAIRFVCDMFDNLPSEQRKKLLHEGFGETILSGYVEICFDNTDRRFPVENDEVFIRRAIGLKKDEFFINSKHTPKQDVIAFMESAGFSRSNPYYIVRQGKVDELTDMNEANRLDLFKEVAGTRVYDEKKAESEKIMRDTNGKLLEVEHILNHIEERLTQLKEEQEELGRFEELDKKKRALEFAYYTGELNKIVKDLAELNEQEESDERSALSRTEVLRLENSLKHKEKQLKAVSDKVQNFSEELDLLTQDKKRLREVTANLGLSVDEGKESEKTRGNKQNELLERLENVRRQIEEAKEQITGLKPQYIQLLEREREAKERRVNGEYRRKALYNKQGRTKQFSSKKERDGWIREEMEGVKMNLEEKKREIEGVKKENVALGTKLKKLGELQEKLGEQAEEKEGLVEEIRGGLKEKEVGRQERANQRTSLWKQESELQEKMESCSDELLDAERKLQGSTKRVVRDGIRLILSHSRAKKMKGVYGPLIELFECPPELFSAVEVAGGGSLFHVVVDTDETAAALLKVLNKERVGRVTFIPLNQMRPKVGKVVQTKEVVSLVTKLKYDSKFEKVMQQIFGRYLLCPSLDVACSYAGTDGYSCVTLEGDLVDRKGSMSGGYEERESSSLEAMSKTKKLRGDVDEMKGKLDKVRAMVQEADQGFTRVFGEMQKEQTRLAQSQNSISHLMLQLRATSSEKALLEKHLEEKERFLSTVLLASLSQFQQMFDSLEAELKAPFSSNLSSGEASELKSIDAEIERLVGEEAKEAEERAKVEEQKQMLENTIFNNLLLQEDRLRKELTSLTTLEVREFSMMENQLGEANSALREVEERGEEIEREVEHGKEIVVRLEKEVEAVRTDYDEKIRLVQQESKSRENILKKRNLLNKQRDERVKLIGELGPLPANEEYEGVAVRELREMLQEANVELGGLSKVNKKAGDQYRTFQEQRTELLKRKEALDLGAKKIEELVLLLDDKKAEAIQRTFRDVGYNFGKVFQELVPGGCGKVVMKTGEGDSSSSSSSSSSQTVRQYVGVGIKVSFSSKNLEDAMPLHQLSGGQKSLVALALIFAIQRCDPAPFYILDEIDAALDPGHRKAVANMIGKQAGMGSDEETATQYIYASFGEELVQKAEKHYRVSLEKNRSRFEKVGLEGAMETLRQNQKERKEAQK